jgi:hypothetical protein
MSSGMATLSGRAEQGANTVERGLEAASGARIGLEDGDRLQLLVRLNRSSLGATGGCGEGAGCVPPPDNG